VIVEGIAVNMTDVRYVATGTSWQQVDENKKSWQPMNLPVDIEDHEQQDMKDATDLNQQDDGKYLIRYSQKPEGRFCC
jgi:hypothetical protein